ncbi:MULTISPECIES: FecR family protein [Sphingobacterium]|uniref:FecR family protein n=1 Tax=Sphingobacterium populi TaxID=1812824 RepID=A0ABW5UIP5_9SPHI|nr:FecR family protein [Sphingobacterium sp. CFCC 11742]
MVDPTIEKLISDHSFVNFCLDKNADDSAYWKDWLSRNPAYSDIANEARQIVLLLADQPTEQELETERTRLIDHITAQKVPVRSRFYRWFRPSVAAAAVLLFGVLLLQHWRQIEHNPIVDSKYVEWVTQLVPEKKIMHIALADGTAVKLFPGSHFSYPEIFEDTIREVRLNGGGSFDVKHDAKKPFIIHTEELSVRVLGTSFNMHAYDHDNQTKVALFNGKVVIAHRGTEQALVPGQAFVLDKNTQSVEVQSFDTQQERQVANGMIVFDHADYKEVVNQLTRKYGVRWNSSAEVDIQFSGIIFQEPLSDVLDHLSYTTDYSFTLENNIVHVQKH